MAILKCPECGKDIMVSLNVKNPDDESKRYICEKCNNAITEGVSNWSLKHYGRALCMNCQGKAKE